LKVLTKATTRGRACFLFATLAPDSRTTPQWTGRYEVVVMPQGDVPKEDAKPARFDSARHLREMIEHDPTLGGRVTGHEAVRTEFNEKTGVVEVAATIDEP
jgi:hypothetical protein